MRSVDAAPPTAQQIRAAHAVTAWYLDRYHGTSEDVGVARMFTDPARVGEFAVDAAALAVGDGPALFRVLMATVMFQRRQDLQIMRVLRGLSADEVDELCSPARLLALADGSGCVHASTLSGLLERCDLRKDEQAMGVCAANPDVACACKRHAKLLKRYGHFGKVPTGLALTLREHHVGTLPELRAWAIGDGCDERAAAARLEAALRRAWRVSDKIAAMFLSMLANPDLCPGLSPWSEGLDWRRWVVIDSNVDLFLASIGYAGQTTYAARAGFVRSLAARIDLSSMKPGMVADNPRIVQQAMYLFMSTTNRRALGGDCARVPDACSLCAPELSLRCGLRRVG